MTIHPQTNLGPVHLQVADLGNLVNYYTTLGLHLHQRQNRQAVLGDGTTELLVLNERPDGQRVRGTSGLYHFAILLPSRADLGRALRHFGQSAVPVGGASDHAVSEALYLTDPEGNGIEVYRDRPRDEWRYPNGQLVINTTPFDVAGVLAAGDATSAAWDGFPAGTIIGHMHLHVGDIDAAEGFYRDALGFDLSPATAPAPPSCRQGAIITTWGPTPGLEWVRHLRQRMPGGCPTLLLNFPERKRSPKFGHRWSQPGCR